MNLYRTLASLFLGSITLLSCQETVTTLAPDDKPVIEAYLAPGQPMTVHITKQIPFNADTTGQGQPIAGLALKISSNTATYALRYIGDGLYQSAAEVMPRLGQTYTLAFDYLGQRVTATTQMPTKPAGYQQDVTELIRTAPVQGGPGGGPGGGGPQQQGAVRLSWQNPTADYYFVVIDNIEATPVLINQNVNPNRPLQQNRRFRNQPTQSDFDDVRGQSFQYYGRHRMVLFHLNPDYAALYKQNSTSTQNIATPPTTVVNGLGIFTGVNTDTLYVNVKPQ
ncbi:hypothetical protein J2I47_09630 [Fibrella sp. HMF5335]|uniref:DUF4249 domain-containing protein n=1 Tax=Fibrella rubiginis TaxID=2817060 RepID=A0A939K156_9BACT|nr:DUF4249 family protein [Fibrella rubiginis]MBO0936802.1 hypothetical protein [Fibrella rubiginis]